MLMIAMQYNCSCIHYGVFWETTVLRDTSICGPCIPYSRSMKEIDCFHLKVRKHMPPGAEDRG